MAVHDIVGFFPHTWPVTPLYIDNLHPLYIPYSHTALNRPYTCIHPPKLFPIHTHLMVTIVTDLLFPRYADHIAWHARYQFSDGAYIV